MNRKNCSSTVIQTCTPCCPFDAKNISHPQFTNQTISNSDTCCLSKLQVDCRIQTRKKKKKRFNKVSSSRSMRRNTSSSSRLSPYVKRKKFDSTINTNSHYIHSYESNTQVSSTSSSTTTINESDSTEQSFSSQQYYNKSSNAQSQIYTTQNIQDLKTSIDNLTQLVINQQKSTSFFTKLRHFFSFFKSSSTPSDDSINEECLQILERNHLTKQKLLNIYQLFDKNETLFLNWLQTIIPNYFLPLLLNYVKHFDSISTDNI